jgi:transcriptional regulator with XRE-family HTH domain
VKSIIVANGETLVEVAADVGVNAHTLGQILNRRIRPWPALVERLERRYDLPAADLFFDEEVVAS